MHRPGTLGSIFLLTTIYFLLGKATLAFATLPGGVTPVWPAAGIAFGSVLLLGRRVWPGIALGAFLLHLASHGLSLSNVGGGLGIGLGNTLLTLLPIELLRRWIVVPELLHRSQNVFRFVALIIPANFLSATSGVTLLCLTQITPWEAYRSSWWTWAISNIFGVLLVVPLLLIWTQRPPKSLPLSPSKLARFTLLGLLVFAINYVAWYSNTALEFMLIPLLVWSAFQLGHRGTTLLLVLIYSAAVIRIVYGASPSGLPSESINTSLVLFQAFIGVTTLMTLVLLAVIQERQQAEARLIIANQELQLLAGQLQESNAALERANDELEARVEERTCALKAEQEKAENLLLNILPRSIAEQLKQEEKSIADGFEEVTVLFADIVGFTEFSGHVSPQELVSMLNQIFSAFDHLSAKYGLEKIKTIGDAYMVVGGVPEPRVDHAEAVAAMALEMLEAVDRWSAASGNKTRIRIGINTGPVVAGVIGTKKFIYDLWGDTVNIASRMESLGEPNRIQMTQATYEHLKTEYCCEQRGSIAVKGRGTMTTYWLIGKKVEEPLASLIDCPV